MKSSKLTWLLLVIVVALLGATYYLRSPQVETNTLSSPVRNLNIKAGQLVTSPLTITGEAKGWYFEGSFPAKITDDAGNVLGNAPMQAQGDWMSENFVPFRAIITFSDAKVKTGYLILSKDNESGLPEHDISIKIPVRFR